MKRARKTTKRLRIIEKITAAMSASIIYKMVDVRQNSESEWSLFLHSHLLNVSKEILHEQYPNATDATIEKRAYDALLWDSDKSTVIRSITLFGVQHRPDYEVKLGGFAIGIELKRGNSGADVRAGFGQSLVYAQRYDFVLYLFADISDDKRIAASTLQPKEQQLLNTLWEKHNIRFVVV